MALGSSSTRVGGEIAKLKIVLYVILKLFFVVLME